MQLISLTVKTRRGVAVNQVELIDIDDIAGPIIGTNGGTDSSFVLREGKKGPFPYSPTNTYLTEYVVDQDITAIQALSSNMFSANVLTARGRTVTGSPLMAFMVPLVSGTIKTHNTGSEFFYQEDADPSLVAYTVSQDPANIKTQVDAGGGGGGGSSTINIGRSLFVSASTGNDGTALPYRMDKMYSTGLAANAAAVSGDTVFFYPGTYSGRIFLKDGVNYHLYKDAILTASGASPMHDNGVSVACTITGGGSLVSTTDSSLYVSGATSDIAVIGVTLGNANLGGVEIRTTAGKVLLRNTRLIGQWGIGLIGTVTSNVILDNVTLISTSESIFTTAPNSIKIYSAVANNNTSVGITNLVSGTVLYVDPDIS